MKTRRQACGEKVGFAVLAIGPLVLFCSGHQTETVCCTNLCSFALIGHPMLPDIHYSIRVRYRFDHYLYQTLERVVHFMEHSDHVIRFEIHTCSEFCPP